MEQAADALRPLWWRNCTVHPLFDVGMFRLTDPRPAAQNVELATLKFESIIAQLNEAKINAQSQISLREAFLAYTKKHHIGPHARILELHIPPRPMESIRTLPTDLHHSAAQLAGWTHAFNCYHPKKPIGLLRGLTSLAGSKRAPAIGFEQIQLDQTPWPISDRLDIIEHLVQNASLKAEDLLQAPMWTMLTSRRTFTKAHDIHRYKNTKFTLQTTDGHTIELPHEGNGWQLWLRSTGSRGITNHDAQVFRGAIQVATAVAHDAGEDIRIRVPDEQPFLPYTRRAPRTIGPWGLYHRMGTPVRSFGYPSLAFITQFIPAPHEHA